MRTFYLPGNRWAVRVSKDDIGDDQVYRLHQFLRLAKSRLLIFTFNNVGPGSLKQGMKNQEGGVVVIQQVNCSGLGPHILSQSEQRS